VLKVQLSQLQTKVEFEMSEPGLWEDTVVQRTVRRKRLPERNWDWKPKRTWRRTSA